MWRTIIEVLGPIIGVIVGWVANNYLAYYFQRAKIRIDIHNVFLKNGITSAKNSNLGDNGTYLDDTEIFKVPSEIRDKLEECKYIRPPRRYYDSRKLYIKYLIEAKKALETLEFLYAEVPKILRELEMNVNTGMYESFYRNWLKIQDILNLRFMQCHVQGELIKIEMHPAIEYILSQEDTEDDNQEENVTVELDLEALKKIRIEKDKYYFNFEGRVIQFTFEPQDTILKEFSKALITSLLVKDKEQLNRIIAFLKSLKWKDEIITENKKLIISEIQGFDRIVIKGMLMNSGRTPIAINGQAEIVILSKGFKYHQGHKVLEIDNDITIPINIVNQDNAEVANTVIVNGGEAVAFTAQSIHYLRNMSDPLYIQIKEIYNMERECLVKGIRLDNNSSIESNKIKFREFNEDDPILR